MSRFIKGQHASLITEFKKGQNKDIPRTEEVKRKISLANKGKPSWIKGKTWKEVYNKEKIESLKQALKESAKKRKGFKHTPETILKMSIIKLGKKKSEKTKQKMSFVKKGFKHSDETKRKLSEYFKGKPILNARGEKSGNWKGGITPLVEIIRHSLEFKQWRKEIFERDNYTCRKCFEKSGKLHPHHKKRFYIILSEFLKEYSQFSPIEDKETLFRLAIKYSPFWNIDNGQTLCKNCHKIIHKEEKYVKR